MVFEACSLGCSRSVPDKEAGLYYPLVVIVLMKGLTVIGETWQKWLVVLMVLGCLCPFRDHSLSYPFLGGAAFLVIPD